MMNVLLSWGLIALIAIAAIVTAYICTRGRTAVTLPGLLPAVRLASAEIQLQGKLARGIGRRMCKAQGLPPNLWRMTLKAHASEHAVAI